MKWVWLERRSFRAVDRTGTHAATARIAIMRQTLSLLLSVVNYPNLVQHVEDDSHPREALNPCWTLRSYRMFANQMMTGDHAVYYNKLPIEIVVRADERHHTSVRKPRTHASQSGLSSTNVGAGCSCHPTGAKHHRSPRSFTSCLTHASCTLPSTNPWDYFWIRPESPRPLRTDELGKSAGSDRLDCSRPDQRRKGTSHKSVISVTLPWFGGALDSRKLNRW